MDIRTYPDELAILRSKNERLRAELGQCVSENNQLAENAAELGKALDMALAEMDAHSRELDALRDERPRLLAANVRLHHDNIALRADHDNERNAHNATAAQLYAQLAALRAELDAMRQAHSVVAAKMQAMGC